jgi:hypothetical protein
MSYMLRTTVASTVAALVVLVYMKYNTANMNAMTHKRHCIALQVLVRVAVVLYAKSQIYLRVHVCRHVCISVHCC